MFYDNRSVIYACIHAQPFITVPYFRILHFQSTLHNFSTVMLFVLTMAAHQTFVIMLDVRGR